MSEAVLEKQRPAVVPRQENLPRIGRLASIDAYRGLVMLGMICGGFGLRSNEWWPWLGRQFNHAEWEGYVFWDLIQPSFMFLVGAAMPFSFARRSELGESWTQQFFHAVKRALVLILIGIALDSYRYGTFHVAFVRVLQQIAIGYLLTFFVLHWRPWAQAMAAGLLLTVHTAAYMYFGHMQGIDPWLIHENLGAYFDRSLGLPFNPQGEELFNRSGYVTLNALSATATIILGVICGELLRRPGTARAKMAQMAAWTVGCAVLGMLVAWAVPVPVVKKLWTASFGLIAASWTFAAMMLLYAVIDVLGYRRWAFPLIVVGVNSIALYILHDWLKDPLREMVTPQAEPVLQHFPLAQPIVLALLLIGVQWYFCYWLYRQRIFFKV